MSDSPGSTNPVRQRPKAHAAAWICLLAALAVGVYLQNPAVAIHDTSSVVATAAIYGDEAATVATTVKLGRTLWLIPLAFAASLFFARGEARLRVPPFILLFVAAAAIGGLVDFGETVAQGIGFASKVFLVIALGLIGLELDRESLHKLSLSSVVLGVGLWLVTAPLALVLVLVV